MGMPQTPVTLTPEQVAELNEKLATTRHDINNNLSLIMKRLTGVTVILAGIGAIGGLFGMSEASSAISGQEGAGFWAVILVTVFGAAAAAIVLRRINWL